MTVHPSRHQQYLLVALFLLLLWPVAGLIAGWQWALLLPVWLVALWLSWPSARSSLSGMVSGCSGKVVAISLTRKAAFCPACSGWRFVPNRKRVELCRHGNCGSSPTPFPPNITACWREPSTFCRPGADVCFP